MRKYVYLIIIMFIFYLGFQAAFNLLSNETHQNYTVNNVKIKETYRSRKNIGYDFQLQTDNNIFELTTLKTFKKKRKVISYVEVLNSNNYECIYVTYNDSETSNVICMKDNIMYNYQDIIGKDSLLDKLVSNLTYSVKDYTLNDTYKVADETKKIYSDALINDHYLAISGTTGIYLINKSISNNIKKVNLFKNVPTSNISMYYKNYYVTADNDSSNYFEKIYVVDIKTGNISTIKTSNKISFNSYFMGAYGNSAYLLDLTNGKEFEINLSSLIIKEIANYNEPVKYYSINQFLTMNMSSAIKVKPKFVTYTKDSIYEKIEIYGNYKYYYKKDNNQYLVYRSLSKSDHLMYLFTTTNINNVKYVDNYVYFQSNTYLRFYSDDTGVKNVLMFIDDDINFGVEG